MNNIYQKVLKLINFFAILVLAFPLIIQAKPLYKIQNPNGETITLRLAIERSDKARGLSGLKSNEFSENEGMLFINKVPTNQKFWMPDTYFNLDIIFLDKDLKIVGIETDVPHHLGVKEPPVIYRTKYYYSQFVLETKAKSKFSSTLKVNDVLKWVGSTALSEIVRGIRP